MKLLLSLMFFGSILCAAEQNLSLEQQQNLAMWGTTYVPSKKEAQEIAKKEIENSYYPEEEMVSIFCAKARDYIGTILKGIETSFGDDKDALAQDASYQNITSVLDCLNEDRHQSHLQVTMMLLDCVRTNGSFKDYEPLMSASCPECHQSMGELKQAHGLTKGAVWGITEQGLYPAYFWLEGFRYNKVLSTLPIPSKSGDAFSAHEGEFQGYGQAYVHDYRHREIYIMRRFCFNELYETTNRTRVGDALEQVALEMMDEAESREDRIKVALFLSIYLHEPNFDELPLDALTSQESFKMISYWNALSVVSQLKTIFPEYCGSTIAVVDLMKEYLPILKEKLPFTLKQTPFESLKDKTRMVSKDWLGEEKSVLDTHDMKIICDNLLSKGFSLHQNVWIFSDSEVSKEWANEIYAVSVPRSMGKTVLSQIHRMRHDKNVAVLLISPRDMFEKSEDCPCTQGRDKYIFKMVADKVEQDPFLNEALLQAAVDNLCSLRAEQVKESNTRPADWLWQSSCDT